MLQTLLKTWLRLVLLLPIIVLAACVTEKAPSGVPQNLKVTPGDGRVTLTWEEDPSLVYWVFSAQNDKITPDNYKDYPDSRLTWPARPGVVISGLTNDKIYAFTINTTKSGSPSGPAAESVAATPRPSGDSWAAGAPAGTTNLNALISVNGTLVTAGDGGALYSATKGDIWKKLDAGTGFTNNLRGLVYDTVQLIAVGEGGLARISSNFLTDTPTWKVTTTNTPAQLNSVAYGASTYVAVGAGGVIVSGVGATDATTTPASATITWTLRTSGVMDNLNKVVYLNSQFVALGDAGTILTSPDGITWTKQVSTTNVPLRDIAMVLVDKKPNYLAVGGAGTILRSTNLILWTSEASGTALDLNAIAVTVGSRTVIAGVKGTILYGTGSTTWTAKTTGLDPDVTALVSSNGGYIGVGPSGSNAHAY
ncbi:hypothetical protein [Chitinimonas sp. BJB300]|uniref:hypothetical protein n=1 Tax=Chitinimonas sp. BJB300 TaxID=1559339 RepID=UPI00111277C3|nr:hypothetical protein [Chitinimonas sp. BJB300]TSJ87285.1 hypothetical protein FG002_015000 [Chitinimonas sp. BJB300]